MESEIKTKDDIAHVDENKVLSIAKSENVIFVLLCKGKTRSNARTYVGSSFIFIF